jgi:hypothetical protein
VTAGDTKLEEGYAGTAGANAERRWSRSLTNGWRSPRGRRQRRLPSAVVIDSPSLTGIADFAVRPSGRHCRRLRRVAVVVVVVNTHPLS